MKTKSRFKKVRRRLPAKPSAARAKKRAIKHRIRKTQPLHKRFFLHPVTILILLCAGVLIIGWTFKVVADSYTISALVPAPPLNEGANITSPADGSVITSQPIPVNGTCPDGSYVKLYINNTFSGVALCSSNDTFTIETDLFVGANVLLAQDYNQTDQAGPTTPTMTITYQPPASSSGGTSSSNFSSSSKSSSSSSSVPPKNVPPLLLTSDFHYQTFITGSSFSWTLTVQGGTSPYKVSVNWGDDQTSIFKLGSDPTFKISHTYKKNGYYAVIVTVTDAKNQTRIMQLAALIKQPGAPGIYSTVIPPTTKPNNSFINWLNHTGNYLWLAWPTYLIILLMVFSFWLGERQEFRNLRRRYRN